MICGSPILANSAELPSSSWVQFDSFTYTGVNPFAEQLGLDNTKYLNPILAGFYPDPSICRVGPDYFLVNSTFTYFPCIPIWHSTDLVHWRQLGNVIDRPTQIGSMAGLHLSEGMYAPTIRYHAGKFFIICTFIGGRGNFFVTADKPAGPWSDPIWLPDINGIDPSFFFDQSGKAWVVHNDEPPDKKSLYNGHRAIWMAQVDLQSGKIIGQTHLVVNGGTDLSKHPIWIEAPHLFMHEGFHYLIAAEGGTADEHSEVVFRSKELLGPYVPYEANPILTQRDLPRDRHDPITCAGHADFVQLPNGDWWSVFLACQPYEDVMFNTGRETFLLPVHWANGWPAILPAKTPLPRALPRPSLPAQAEPAAPTTGTFTQTDSFNNSQLAPSWLFVRTPTSNWYSLQDRPGSLLIEPRSIGLSSTDNPSIICRRQQHATFSTSVLITINPSTADCDAGLAAFQNEGHWLFLAIRCIKGSAKEIVLEQMNASDSDLALNPPPSSQRLAAGPLPPGSKKIWLMIDGVGCRYSFLFKTDDKNDWSKLKENVDGSILSTSKAGGFQGVTLGMFARKR